MGNPAEWRHANAVCCQAVLVYLLIFWDALTENNNNLLINKQVMRTKAASDELGERTGFQRDQHAEGFSYTGDHS